MGVDGRAHIPKLWRAVPLAPSWHARLGCLLDTVRVEFVQREKFLHRLVFRVERLQHPRACRCFPRKHGGHFHPRRGRGPRRDVAIEFLQGGGGWEQRLVAITPKQGVSGDMQARRPESE